MDRFSWDDDESSGLSTPVTAPDVLGTLSFDRTTPPPAPNDPAAPRSTTQPVGGSVGLNAGTLQGVGVSAPPSTPAPPASGTAIAGAPPDAALPQPQTAGRLVKPQTDTRTAMSGGADLSALSQKAATLGTITDPTEKARVTDEVARGVAEALKASGRKVAWKGDTLMVDGRAYVVGGSQTASAAATGGPVEGAHAAGAAQAQGQPVETPTITTQPVDPSQQIERYPREVQGTVIDPGYAWAKVNEAFSARFPRGMSPEEQEAIKRAVGFDPTKPVTQAMLDQALELIGQYSGNLQNPFPNTPAPTPGGPGTPPGAGTPAWRAAWEGYNPGTIPFEDLEGMSVDDLMARLGGPVAAGGQALDPETEAAVRNLLANPHALDQLTVDTMKARSKDELAELAAQEDEALRHYGFDTGIADSNWIQSERLASRRDRDRALVGSNREIDILAAQTRKEDERKAAEMGMGFTNQRFGQALASKAEQRQAVALAADSSLRASALRGDRLALREQINAKAAELGLDADRLQLQYTLGLMDDLTKRYGIDVGKEIDLKKLSEQGRQFNEELALKFAQLQFAYDELAKRDEWAQLNAGVQLAGYGYSGVPGAQGAPGANGINGPDYDGDGDFDEDDEEIARGIGR